MDQFKISDQVYIPKMNQYGVVIYYNEKDNKLLVRIGAAQQLYFAPEELELKK